MLDRNFAPAFAIPNKLFFLKPQEITLPNDLSVCVFNGGHQPVIRIEIIYKSGRWFETLPGRAYFTAKMLSEGSRNYSSTQVASAFEKQGAHFEAQPGFDYTTIALHSLTSKLPNTLPVLLDILAQPTFSATELEKLKSIYAQSLAINLEKNNYVSAKLLREALYGLEHPYGRDIEIDEISAITHKELFDFYSENYTPHKIFISGALSQNELDLILNTLQTIPIRHKESHPKLYTERPTSKLHIDKPESTQSSVRLATSCANRNDPDYFSLLLFNQVLGGYFGSRLMKNIREEKGLTYGIHSGVNAFKNNSHFVISTEVNKENTKVAIEEIYKEINALSDNTISLEEHSTAVNNFIGSLQSDLSTIFAHSDKFKNTQLYNLPEDYYDKMVEFFIESSPDKLKAFAENFVKNIQFHEIIVG